MSAKTDAALALGKSIARSIGVPLSKLTKDMVRNAQIPSRYKKVFFGPDTEGEKKIRKAIMGSVTTAKQELKALGTGTVIGALGANVTSQIMNAVKDSEKKKAKPNVRVGIKTGTKKKPKVTKPMGFASTAKDKQIKSSSKKAVKKALSSQPKKKVVKPKPRPKSGAPKKSLRPRMRPGS
tara:strand:+ start:69 stop:608 length:540 start_codon:yes stop_codon:yes gene_type:complete